MTILDRIVLWLRSTDAKRRIEANKRRAARVMPEVCERQKRIAALRMKHVKASHIEREQCQHMTQILRSGM